MPSNFCSSESDECISYLESNYSNEFYTSLISVLVLIGLLILIIVQRKKFKQLFKIFIHIVILNFCLDLDYFIKCFVYQKNMTGDNSNNSIFNFWKQSYGLYSDSCKLEGFINFFIVQALEMWNILWLIDLLLIFLKGSKLSKKIYAIYLVVGYVLPIIYMGSLGFISYYYNIEFMGSTYWCQCYLSTDSTSLGILQSILTLVYLIIGILAFAKIFLKKLHQHPEAKKLKLNIYFYLLLYYFIYTAILRIVLWAFGYLLGMEAKIGIFIAIMISCKGFFIGIFLLINFWVFHKNQKYNQNVRMTFIQQIETEMVLNAFIQKQKKLIQKIIITCIPKLFHMEKEGSTILKSQRNSHVYKDNLLSTDDKFEFQELFPQEMDLIRSHLDISICELENLFAPECIEVVDDSTENFIDYRIYSKYSQFIIKWISEGELEILEKFLPSFSEYFFAKNGDTLLEPILACFIISFGEKKCHFILQRNYQTIDDEKVVSFSFDGVEDTIEFNMPEQVLVMKPQEYDEEVGHYLHSSDDFKTIFGGNLSLPSQLKQRLLEKITNELQMLSQFIVNNPKIHMHVFIAECVNITEILNNSNLAPEEDEDEEISSDEEEMFLDQKCFSKQIILMNSARHNILTKKLIINTPQTITKYLIRNNFDYDVVQELQGANLICFDSKISNSLAASQAQSYGSSGQSLRSYLIEKDEKNPFYTISFYQFEKDHFMLKSQLINDSASSSTNFVSLKFPYSYSNEDLLNSENKNISSDKHLSQKKKLKNIVSIKYKSGAYKKHNGFYQLIINLKHGGFSTRTASISIVDYLKKNKFRNNSTDCDVHFPLVQANAIKEKIISKIKSIL